MAALTSALNAVSPKCVELGWTVFWQSIVLVSFVAAVVALTLRRSSPALRFWVWQVLAIKLLVMPFWTHAVPLAWTSTVASQGSVGAQVPAAIPGSATEAEGEPHVPQVQREMHSTANAGGSRHAAKPPTLAWQSWLILAWGAVVLAQGARLAREHVRLTRSIRRAVPANEALLQEVSEAAQRIGLNRLPRVVVAITEHSPFVCGIRHPVLVIPAELVTILGVSQRQQVLLHELAHLRRHDLVWGWIGQCVRSLYFFHPAAHWLAYRLRLESELACDQWAMGISGQGPAEYASTLLSVMAHGPKASRMTAAAASAAGHPQLSTFWKRRLAMLPSLNRAALRPSGRALAVVVVLGLAVLSVPTLRLASVLLGSPPADGPAEGGAESSVASAAVDNATAQPVGGKDVVDERAPEFLPRPSKQEERIEKALEKPVDVNFADTPLEEAIVSLMESADLPHYIDRTALAENGVALDDRITLKLKATPLESVLRLLLNPAQLDFFPKNDVLMITTADRACDALITRTYPIRDLYPEEGKEAGKPAEPAPAADARPGRRSKVNELMNALTSTIQPDSWEELSGPGCLTYVSATGSLVIRQTRPVHREIVQLLRDLRAAKRVGSVAAK